MDVREWLKKLDMEQYAERFEEYPVAVEALDQLTLADLKKMSIASKEHRKRILEAIPPADDIIILQTRQERKWLKDELGELGKRKFDAAHKKAPAGNPEYLGGVMFTILILYLVPPLFIIAEIIFRSQKKRDAGYFVNTGKRYQRTTLFWINFVLSFFWRFVIFLAVLGGMIALAFLL